MGRSSIYGIGINDADYIVTKREVINGKIVQTWMCPIYSKWKGMLERCYSEKFHQNHPTYKDCAVYEDWYYFMNFRKWVINHDWEGKELDKDLLVEGNKLYSPDTCLFLPRLLNTFINPQSQVRGKYMIGVCWHKLRGKYKASCGNPFTGKNEHLGLFTDELQAHLAWKSRKHELSCQLAESDYCTDERVAKVLRVKYL